MNQFIDNMEYLNLLNFNSHNQCNYDKDDKYNNNSFNSENFILDNSK